MTRVRMLAAAAALGLAFLAGCGGSASTPSSSDAASAVPAGVAGFLSFDTDVQSSQWKKAEALLNRFPAKNELLAQIRQSLSKQGVDWETDIKPALGKEIGIVLLDYGNGGKDAVGITKPKDEAKFDALLAKGSSPTPHEKVDGWTVFGPQQQIDQFKKLKDAGGGSLADDGAFKSAMDGLPAESLSTIYLSGSELQSAFDKSIVTAGGPAGAVETYLGRLDSFGEAVSAESNGIRFDASATGDFKANPATYHAELPSVFADGAVAYLSFDHLDHPLRKLLENGSRLSPNFEQQRAQIETLLGVTLDKDVLPLISGEGALALYPTSNGPAEVVLAIQLTDEAKAQKILDRVQTLAQASGQLQVKPVRIGSASALEFVTRTTSIFIAVFDGRLVISNLRSGIEDLQGSGPKLAADPAFSSALAGAGMPDKTAGFFYSDLHGGLDYLFAYLEGKGQTIPKTVRDNLAPLRGLVLYLTKEGGKFTFAGFLGIQ